MSLKIGIVGAPNKGKSTFFKAVTLKDVDIANYPFTTIAPNVGVGFVTAPCPCAELKVTCNPNNSKCVGGTRFIPVELVDIAGLVPEAHEGKGMGNQFLSDISTADVLIHVIDASGKTDVNGEAKDNADISEEIEFLDHEIAMWLYGIIAPKWDKYRHIIQQKKLDPLEHVASELNSLGITEKIIMEALEFMSVDPKKIMDIKDDNLKAFIFKLSELSKRSIILANKADIPGADKNIEAIKSKYPDKIIIPASAEAELALKNASDHGMIDYVPGAADFKISDNAPLNDKQKQALGFLKTNVLEKYGSTGIVEALNRAVFGLMNYIVVYPVENETHYSNKTGQVLPDAILIRSGATALDLAYKIHTDIGKNFIRAINARTKQVIGKDYVLKNNDIIKIVSGK